MFWLQRAVLDVFVYIIIQKKAVMTNLQAQIWTRVATLWVFKKVTLAWSLSDIISSPIESKNMVKHDSILLSNQPHPKENFMNSRFLT